MTGTDGSQSDYHEVEQRQRAVYRFWCKPSFLDLERTRDDPYFSKILDIRLSEIRRYYAGGTALDLCCGSGQYAVRLAGEIERIVGIDFSPEMLRVAQESVKEQNRTNISLSVANARRLPLGSETVGLVYSFSSLYYVPAVEQVVAEVARVLRPKGVAILEFGALYSLNTLVSRATPGPAEPCHVPLGRIYRMHEEAGLAIERDRSFQILPMWGNRPWWIRPLLHPVWKRLLSPRVGGRMLDEWISSFGPLRPFAFRHMVVSRKPG